MRRAIRYTLRGLGKLATLAGVAVLVVWRRPVQAPPARPLPYPVDDAGNNTLMRQGSYSEALAAVVLGTPAPRCWRWERRGGCECSAVEPCRLGGDL